MLRRKIYGNLLVNPWYLGHEGAVLDKSGVSYSSELNKIFIHQANEKYDEPVVKAFFTNFTKYGNCPMT